MGSIGANRENTEVTGHVTAAAGLVVERASRELHDWEQRVSQRKQQLEGLFATLDRSDPLAMQKLVTARQMYDLAVSRTERAIVNLHKRRAEAEAELKIAEAKALRTPPDLQAFVEAHGGNWYRISREAWEQFDEEMSAWRARLLNVETMEK